MTVEKLTLNQKIMALDTGLAAIAILISIFAISSTQAVKVDLTADMDNLKSDFAAIKELQTNLIRFTDNNGNPVGMAIDFNGTHLIMGAYDEGAD